MPCLVSLGLLIAFISYYQVPPLMDFMGHVALGMIHGVSCYQYQFNLTYFLLDAIVRFWYFFMGNHFAHVALASYLSVIFLFFSSIYSFCLLQNIPHQRTWCILGILAGPVFLLLHSTMFICGIIPFILAVFMAATSSVALCCMDEAWVTQTSSKKAGYLCFIYTSLAILSHPAGFLYLAIAWIVPAARILFIRAHRQQRFFYFLAIYIILMISFFVINAHHINILMTQFNAVFLSFDPLVRLHWLFSNVPYDLSFFVPTQESGLFAYQAFGLLLMLASYTIVLLLCLKKTTAITTFLIAQIILQILLMCVLPTKWGELTALFVRHWLFVCAWLFMGMAYLCHQCRPRTFHILCTLSPILTIGCCALLMPLYANFQLHAIEKTAHHYAHILFQSIQQFKENHPEIANQTIVIDYDGHCMPFQHTWRHDTMIPFLMILSPELIQHHITIRHAWYQDDHILTHWQAQPPLSTAYIHWISSTSNTATIQLGSSLARISLVPIT